MEQVSNGDALFTVERFPLFYTRSALLQEGLRRGDYGAIEMSSDGTPTMTGFTTVAKVGAIPGGEGASFQLGNRLIAVFNHQGEYLAIDDLCPHMGASLGAGCLDEEVVITCPWHAWRFDAKTGNGRRPRFSMTRSRCASKATRFRCGRGRAQSGQCLPPLARCNFFGTASEYLLPQLPSFAVPSPRILPNLLLQSSPGHRDLHRHDTA